MASKKHNINSLPMRMVILATAPIAMLIEAKYAFQAAGDDRRAAKRELKFNRNEKSRQHAA